MKTKEFIKRVEKLGYKTEKVHWFITIYDPDNMDEKVAVVNTRSERQLSIYDALYHLTKLLIEYAETPLAEREDEKKYYVKVPHTEDVWYYKESEAYLQTICLVGKELRGKFTEADIERYGLQDCEKVEVTDDEQ